MYKPTSCMNQLISCIPVGLLSSIMVLLNPFQGSVDTLVVYPGILPGLILLNPFRIFIPVNIEIIKPRSG